MKPLLPAVRAQLEAATAAFEAAMPGSPAAQFAQAEDTVPHCEGVDCEARWIPGQEGRYAATLDGRILSFIRAQPRIMRPWSRSRGYRGLHIQTPREIRAKRAAGMRCVDIAAQYGCTSATISRAATGAHWGHVA